MLSKNQLKRYAKLKQKKFRDAEGLFMAEGEKLVQDLISRGAKVESLVCVEGLPLPDSFLRASDEDFKRLSSLENPSGVLGVFQKPKMEARSDSWLLALDGIRDPGNLGTILRCADWFGLSQVICSLDTVDCYNPKAVQASMGSLASILVEYCELPPFLEGQTRPVYGTFMNGVSLNSVELPSAGVLVMGNEGQGIRPEVEAVVSYPLRIDKHPKAQAESLNVAMAAAIFMAALPIRR